MTVPGVPPRSVPARRRPTVLVPGGQIFSGLVRRRSVRAAARLTRRNPCGLTSVPTLVRLIGSGGRGGRTAPPQQGLAP